MIDRLFNRYGIVAFPFTLYSPEGLWSNKRLDSVKGLEKLRIRTVGHQMGIFNIIGSTAIPLPGDIQEAYCWESTRYYEQLSDKDTTFGTMYQAYTNQ